MWAQKLIHHKICFILYFKFCINDLQYRCECDAKESSRLTLFFWALTSKARWCSSQSACYLLWMANDSPKHLLYVIIQSTYTVSWQGWSRTRADESPPPGGSASFSIHKTHTPPTMLCSQCCHKIIDPMRSLISMKSSISFQQPAMKASVKKVYIQARLPL